MAGPTVETEIVDGSTDQRLARKARERRLEVRLLIADLKDGKRTIDDVVELLVRDDRAFDLAQVVSSFSDIPNTQALRALFAKRGERDRRGLPRHGAGLGCIPHRSRNAGRTPGHSGEADQPRSGQL